jgi:hypothetical protein
MHNKTSRKSTARPNVHTRLQASLHASVHLSGAYAIKKYPAFFRKQDTFNGITIEKGNDRILLRQLLAGFLPVF